MRNSHAFLLANLMMLSGCSVGPDFVRPDATVPAQWNAATQRSAALGSQLVTEAPDAKWWAAFNDPTLNRLTERVLSGNHDVQIATLRLAQSRVQRDAAAGARWPVLNASASYQRERQSEVGTGTRMIDILGVQEPNRSTIIEDLSEPFDVYEAGFDAAWELDLWGRVRRGVESAEASFAASNEDLHDVQLSLLAETARSYFALRGIQEQLRISLDDLASGESALELIEYRADGGLVPQLDAVTQRARLAEVRALIPRLRQQETQAINSLALLLGEQPGALAGELSAAAAPPAAPPVVPIGLPSEVARQRPDIRRAEARLHAATAEIGVAVADLYPRITLSGGFVMQSLEASDLGDWGARQWGIGPSLSLPIFDGGRRRATVELRELQQQEAAVFYQRTVLQAWHEIDNALQAYVAEQERQRELLDAVTQSRDAYELANLRYERGLTTFLVVLDAQRTLLQAERSLADSRTTIATQLVGLYKALGGGWSDPS